MKQVTNEEFSELIKNDEEMGKRLADYVADAKDPVELQKKTMEFAKKEGYEFTLSADELANVSGGKVDIDWEAAKKWVGKTYIKVADWWNSCADQRGKIARMFRSWGK